MKAQVGPEIIGVILFLVVVVPALLAYLRQVSEIMNDVPKLKEELQSCQNSLQAIQNENENLKNRISVLENNYQNVSDVLKRCEDTTNTLLAQLDQCNKSVEECRSNAARMSSKILDLQDCCYDSTICNVQLAKCMEFNRTITIVNYQDYSVGFLDVSIDVTYVAYLFLSVPVIDLLSVPLVDFSLVTLDVKFRRKKTEKAVFLIKYIPKIVALTVALCFLLRLPLIPLLILSIVVGLVFCSWLFEQTYKRKWHLFESFQIEMDKILEDLKSKTDGTNS